MSKQYFNCCVAALSLSMFFGIALTAQQQATSQVTPAPPGSAQSTATIKTKVRQVVLDVVVADHKNHPLTGIGKEEFSVFEDGKLQKIISFEVHTGATEAQKVNGRVPPLPILPPNTFLNVSTPWDGLPLNVLLYDVLNTPIEDQAYARKEMVKFLRSRPHGSRFAIFVLGDKLHLLQGFTDDEDLLVSSLNRKEANAMTSLSPPAAAAATPSERLSNSGIMRDPGNLIERMERMDSMAESYFLDRRVEKTIQAFLEISRFLGGWSGRKNLIWLSGAFPAGVLPGGEALDPFAATINYSPEIHEAVDRMTLSQVAVYPVDIRGLTVDPMFSAANSRIFRTPDALAKARARFFFELAADHATMNELAEGSGGHAFYNTNGLRDAIATAVEDGANYYTLSYSPTNKVFNGRLRKIRVTLARKHYSLSYRRSYFADDENKLLQKAARAPFAHIEGTMERGAPLAHEIVFELHVTVEGSPAAATPEQAGELSQFAAFASRKKWDDVQIQRYFFDYWIPVQQLSFAFPSEGTHQTNLEFLAMAYDADGTPMCGRLSAGDETIPAETFEKIRRTAFHSRHQLDVPTQAAWLRVAVRDPAENRVGTVEIRLPLRPERQEPNNKPP
jgi:VWFA-related protein